MDTSTALTELEQRLAAPGGADLRARLMQQLATLEPVSYTHLTLPTNREV